VPSTGVFDPALIEILFQLDELGSCPTRPA
jgi:hypothetical protein